MGGGLFMNDGMGFSQYIFTLSLKLKKAHIARSKTWSMDEYFPTD